MAASLSAFSSGARAGEPVAGVANPDALFQSSDRQLDANKKVIYHFLKDVLAAGRPDLASRYVAKTFVEHDPSVSPRSVVTAPKGDAPAPGLGPIVAVVAENDYVVVAKPHQVVDPVNKTTYTTTWFDMWRLADGKIVEHWGVGTLADNPQGKSAAVPTKGAAEPDALFHSPDPRLNARKQVAYKFIKDIVEAGHWADLAPIYATERYIQHNPNVPSGRDAAVKLFVDVLKIKPSPIADRLKMSITAVVAEGDYVVVALPRPDPTDPNHALTTWIDMWRFDGEKADEHWDPSLAGKAF